MPIARIPEIPTPPPSLAPGPYGDVLIAKMKQKADLGQAAQLPRGPERRQAVYDQLVSVAQQSQAPVVAKLAELKSSGLVTSFESMYLPNALVIRATPGKWGAVEDALRGMADVQAVTQNHTWSVPGVVSGAAEGAIGGALRAGDEPSPAGNLPEWGVEKIGAPDAWARGFTGQGVTIGIVDTGLDASHPAIAPHYRGTNPDGSQTHDYNWFDPTAGRQAPFDDGQHGTHVGGTSAGGTDGRTIGVAPGAKLIAAKAILGSGYNTTEATLRALQFMLAPTDVHGNHPDPSRGADIVNNSWGNADRDDTTFVDTWDAFQAAGIIMVTAAGNDGPGGKVSPPGSYPNGISVAATGSNDKVAGFSSRGPSRFDPKAVIPMIAAPGAGVTSSVPGGRYSNFSGTSMASPHVAGAVALMLSAKPTATYDEIVTALESTATDIAEPGPDNSAGYGRINVNKAIDALLAGSAAQPQPEVVRPAA